MRRRETTWDRLRRESRAAAEQTGRDDLSTGGAERVISQRELEPNELRRRRVALALSIIWVFLLSVAWGRRNREPTYEQPPAGSYRLQSVALSGLGETQIVNAGFVTPRFFEARGLLPLVGRVPASAEYGDGGTGVVVMSHQFWQKRAGGAPQIIGTTMRVDGATVYIVGVMPPSFTFPPGVDLWLPEKAGAERVTGR